MDPSVSGESAPLLHGGSTYNQAHGSGSHGKTAAAAVAVAAEVAAAEVGPIEQFLLWGAFLIQVGGLVGIPFFLKATGAELMESTLSAAALLMISIAWLPALQDRMITPADRNHPMTARTQASVLGHFLRIVFTISWLFVLVKYEEKVTFDNLSAGLANIKQSKYLTPFLLHLFTSLAGYHASRMACAMSIQPVAFAFPLLLSTPISILMVATACRGNTDGDGGWHGFSMYCLEPGELTGYVVISIALWVSQTVVMWRTAFNSRGSLLALDKSLFYQSSYNSILLEQYTLLNRRAPLPATQTAVTTDPDDARVRIYVCSTMYREARHEMKQLLASLLKLDSTAKNVFESHVFLDGGIKGTQLGKFAIQLISCLREEIKAQDEVDAEDWITTGQRIVTPYGMRIEYQLPNGTPFCLHLKDGGKVKAKKRWSQVMYMYVGRNKQPPLATKNLLEVTGGLRPLLRGDDAIHQ